MRDVKEVELKTIGYLLFGGGIENLFIYSSHLLATYRSTYLFLSSRKIMVSKTDTVPDHGHYVFVGGLIDQVITNIKSLVA